MKNVYGKSNTLSIYLQYSPGGQRWSFPSHLPVGPEKVVWKLETSTKIEIEMQNDAQKRLLTIMIYGINSSCKLTLIRFGGMYVQLGDVKLLLPAYTENKDSG